MKNPGVMNEQTTDHDITTTTRFIRRPMQSGLLAKALAYTNSAMASPPPTSPAVTGKMFHSLETKPVSGDVGKNRAKEDINNNLKTNSLQEEVNPERTGDIVGSTKYESSISNVDITSPPSSVVSEEEDTQGDMRHLAFNSTQQLRSGFFRSIKRQYSPIIQEKEHTEPEVDTVPDMPDFNASQNRFYSSPDKKNNPVNMAKFARKKLDQLRSKGAQNVDVSTGLQWIRLELVKFVKLIFIHKYFNLKFSMKCASRINLFSFN